MDAAGHLGGFFSDADGLTHGFVYDNGSYAVLDAPNSAGGTFVQTMDSTGKVAGYYLDGSNQAHGFIYANGSYILPELNVPGATNTYIYAIADDGGAAGFHDLGDPGASHG